MNWDENDVLGPCCINTPDVEGDIAHLFFEDDENEDARAKISSIEQPRSDKLKVLAERLEFIDHLSAIVAEFKKQTKTTSSNNELSDGRARKTVTYHLELWGHDFAGADFDIEALVVYLLMTCIDTIKGQPEPVDAFKWLSDQASHRRYTSLEGFLESLTELGVEFKEAHGLSRLFISAFIEDLSDELKKRLVNSLAVVKIDKGKITQESKEAWEKRTPDDKVKKLASTLYEVRSKFTHSAIRSFCPSQPVTTYEGRTENAVIVQLPDGDNFLTLMRKVIVFLARKLVIEH